MVLARIYGRQSIEKKDSISIETQIEKGIALCTAKGWDYKVYTDSGFSGKDLNRPGFKKMMHDIIATKDNKKNMVIAYRLDRISRSMADFSNLILEFEEYNTSFTSVTENFDTSTPLGRAMVNIIMTFAQLERETTVTRVTDNYYSRTKRGYWGGGPAPYGYGLQKKTSDDGKHYTILVPDEKEAPVVKKIYEWYLEPDASVGKILDKLYDLGVPSRGNSQGTAVWTSRVVSEILWRPLYAPNDIKIYNYFRKLNANFVNDVSEFDGTKAVNLYGKLNKTAGKHKRCRPVNEQYFIISLHEPLIDSDTWIKVQIKKSDMRCKPPRQGTGKNSVFTGLMKCGVCGYSVSSSGDGKGYKNYMCSTRKNRGKALCSLPIISHRIANEIIFSDMKEHLSSKEIRKKINSAKEKPVVSSDYLLKKNELEMKLLKYDSEIDNLISSIAEGNSIMSKYINDKITALDSNKKIIIDELNDMELDEYEETNKIDNINEMLSVLDDVEKILDSGDFDQIKSLCHLFIKSITFMEDKSINIDYYI